MTRELPLGHTAVMAGRVEARDSAGWHPIPSWPGYFANVRGQIRGRRGKPLKPFHRPDGYVHVALCDNGRKVQRMVHALVCEAFHGPKPPNKDLAAHGDGHRSNNVPSNLRWATYKENSADMVAHGTRMSGEKHPNAQLSEAQVREIRRRHQAVRGNVYAKRGTRIELAAAFNVSVSIIKDVVSRRSWREVQP